MAGNTAESGRTVTSKVTAILLAFSRGTTHTLTELARLTGLPVSTVHRLAAELVARRLLDRTTDGSYRIGLPLRVIAGDPAPPARPAPLWDHGTEVMTDLAVATRSPARLGVLADDRVVATRMRPGAGPSSAGPSSLPAHATAMGRALLAFSPAAVVDRLLAEAPAPDRLRRALGVTRLTHLAVLRETDGAEGTAGTQDSSGDGSGDGSGGAIAMPVFGAGGVLLAALELTVPDLRAGLAGARAALAVATGSLSRTLATGPAGEAAHPTPEAAPGPTCCEVASVANHS
jgi:DNA-binding IclR family transcriptional regulator